LLAAALRHLTAVTDPSEDSIDEESGLHHATHAVASLLIYLWKEGEDYRPSKYVQAHKPRVFKEFVAGADLKAGDPVYLDWRTDVSFDDESGMYSLHMPTNAELRECGCEDLADLREKFGSYDEPGEFKKYERGTEIDLDTNNVLVPVDPELVCNTCRRKPNPDKNLWMRGMLCPYCHPGHYE
jgi:hypothetical protein